MSFLQLSALIPILKDISLFHTSQIYTPIPDSHAIVIVTQGHVTIRSENQSPIICSEGFALHAKEGSFHIEVPKTKQAEYAFITYQLFPENQEWSLSGPLYSISKEKIYYMIDELVRIRTLSQQNRKENAEVQFIRERLMLERILFIYLYESGMKKQTTTSLIEETVSYLNEHYMLEIKLPYLAERAGLSAGHFTVLFKKHTGTTLTTYLLQLRIEKAKQYLLQSTFTASEVAQKVGFSDYFYFSRSFKRVVGCSPTIFREKVKEIGK